jgi:hypothetical protein
MICEGGVTFVNATLIRNILFKSSFSITDSGLIYPLH